MSNDGSWSLFSCSLVVKWTKHREFVYRAVFVGFLKYNAPTSRSVQDVLYDRLYVVTSLSVSAAFVNTAVAGAVGEEMMTGHKTLSLRWGRE